MTEFLLRLVIHPFKCFHKLCLVKFYEDDLAQIRDTFHEVIVKDRVYCIDLLLIDCLKLLFKLLRVFLDKLVEPLLRVVEVTGW